MPAGTAAKVDALAGVGDAVAVVVEQHLDLPVVATKRSPLGATRSAGAVTLSAKRSCSSGIGGLGGRTSALAGTLPQLSGGGGLGPLGTGRERAGEQ